MSYCSGMFTFPRTRTDRCIATKTYNHQSSNTQQFRPVNTGEPYVWAIPKTKSKACHWSKSEIQQARTCQTTNPERPDFAWERCSEAPLLLAFHRARECMTTMYPPKRSKCRESRRTGSVVIYKPKASPARVNVGWKKHLFPRPTPISPIVF
jgi:hypothetical protein